MVCLILISESERGSGRLSAGLRFRDAASCSTSPPTRRPRPTESATRSVCDGDSSRDSSGFSHILSTSRLLNHEEEHPSGAKAHVDFAWLCGTACDLLFSTIPGFRCTPPGAIFRRFLRELCGQRTTHSSAFSQVRSFVAELLSMATALKHCQSVCTIGSSMALA
jgi:hypothetical protein